MAVYSSLSTTSRWPWQVLQRNRCVSGRLKERNRRGYCCTRSPARAQGCVANATAAPVRFHDVLTIPLVFVGWRVQAWAPPLAGASGGAGPSPAKADSKAAAVPASPGEPQVVFKSLSRSASRTLVGTAVPSASQGQAFATPQYATAYSPSSAYASASAAAASSSSSSSSTIAPLPINPHKLSKTRLTAVYNAAQV